MDMSLRNSASRCSVVLALGIVTALMPVTGLSAATQQRPISDFLDTQGTYCTDDGQGGCYLFVPPDPNFLGWSTMIPLPPKLPVVRSRPAVPLFAGIDYAGLADAYKSGEEPLLSGTVTERPFSDGRAEVTVILHTKNANAWVIDLDLNGDVLDQIANKPTLFGHRPRDVAAGARQALGDLLLHIVFINTAPGAPLPDLVQLNNNPGTLPGTELKFLGLSMSATGPLTAQYGVPEGTPGKCTIVQTGLIQKAGQSRALTDGFPVEDINLQQVGR
ncbi:MAG TPA: hypothetical protein VKG21_21675 [Casimicrobiaceae bacterium]|nr:hypothetical protein [Casimicrobiaceae bacterium]